MKSPSPFNIKEQNSAIIFALIGQAVWLPVFFTSSADNYIARNSAGKSSSHMNDGSSSLKWRPTFKSYTSSTSTSNSSSFKGAHGHESSGFVLRSALQAQPLESSAEVRVLRLPRSHLLSYNSSLSDSLSISKKRPTFLNNVANFYGIRSSINKPISRGIIYKSYSQSELLGGTLTLNNMNEPLMPALARAERAQWNSSGDPLAPLPQPWREPMRRALIPLLRPSHPENQNTDPMNSPNLSIDTARFVHVPSARITRTTQVPLALQSDGSIDILSKTYDPILLDEINRWSIKQRLPQKGRISAAVVTLHPLVNRPENLDINTVSSEIQPIPRIDHSAKTRPVLTTPLEAMISEKSFSNSSGTKPSDSIPSRIGDSSALETTVLPLPSSQASDKNSGGSSTVVPQPDSQGPTEALREVES